MNEGRLVGRAVLVPRRDIADALEAQGVLPSRVFVSQPDPRGDPEDAIQEAHVVAR
jgi:hypothetical protein